MPSGHQLVKGLGDSYWLETCFEQYKIAEVVFTQSIAFPFLLHTKNMLKLFMIIWMVFKSNETFYIKNLKLTKNNMHTVFKSLHTVEI